MEENKEVENKKENVQLGVKLPFYLDSKMMIFDEDFIVSDDIVYSSSLLFETPMLLPYVSKFTRGANKNITMSNIFKMCVLLGCSPNDLFDWEQWRGECLARMIQKKDYKISNEDIKEML